ncbi:N-acetylmuramidase domain-containing protein [Chitinimonas koreensis]|uniref:N-acetylmuramidase domain-containing protein n=1 Tax=Chitinimonas koreensis TaxID=356302 RepID=UPI0003F5A32A|nr:N-acetylmuramidase family protein [Chitinimonas koreensis]QNM96386.1 DUF3380 domain-containing protein [Chitinimonas koreensis]
MSVLKTIAKTVLKAALRRHDVGLDVVELQELLTIAGHVVKADGLFGDATEAAVRAAQARFGLVVDGQAGPKTLAALRAGDADPRHLREADLVAAADKLGVPLATVKAINAVESKGVGFLPGGQPVLLFERPVMYRQLKAAGHDADALAVQFPNLVSRERGGYAGGATEWHRYLSACHIDPACAIEAASWGAWQVMGYHWRELGYTSAAAFLAEMQTSERAQLDAFVRFVLNDETLLKALRARKWAEVARLYNGPAYRDNDYDGKLARAYARFDAATAGNDAQAAAAA